MTNTRETTTTSPHIITKPTTELTTGDVVRDARTGDPATVVAIRWTRNRKLATVDVRFADGRLSTGTARADHAWLYYCRCSCPAC